MCFRLRTLLILLAAVPIWAYLIVIVPQGTGFGGELWRYLAAPLVLIGITAALWWPLRKSSDGLAWAILLSPIIALGLLSIVSTALS